MASDSRQAANWYRRAPAGGDPWAMFNLADLHLRGEAVPRDAAEAKRLYADAACGGLLQALILLGMLAETGAAGPPERAAALACYTVLTEHGDP